MVKFWGKKGGRYTPSIKKNVYHDKFIIIYYSKGFKVYIKCTITVYEQAYQSLLSLKINSTVAFLQSKQHFVEKF